MNWKEINEAYPLAVLELFRQTIDEDAKAISKINLGWMEVSYGARGYGNFPEDVLESQLLSLPEYFDALGIHVGVRPLNEWDGSVFFAVEVLGKNGGAFSAIKEWSIRSNVALFQFPTRRKALEAGVIKAFEIREEQLKQKEK